MKRNIILVCLVLLAAAGIVFFQKNAQTVTLNQQNTSVGEYKKFEVAGFESEIPSDWSLVFNGERLITPEFGEYILNNPVASFGIDKVMYGDIAWEQVDVFIAEQDLINKLVPEDRSSNAEGKWSTENVGGKEAIVFIANLDNGQVTKGGTGGKTYYFRLAGILKTLVISKQSLGGNEFEQVFDHFIKTAKFVY